MKLGKTEIPNRGLILVLGDAGSGKDVCVGNALLREAVASKTQVITMSESQCAFGNPRFGEPDRSFEKAATIEGLMDRNLVVLITQGVNNWPHDFREFLLTHASVLVVLRSRDLDVGKIFPDLGEYIMERTYKKWWFITTHIPNPATYRTAGKTGRFAEAAICVRQFERCDALPADHWDRVVFARLPIVRDNPANEPVPVTSPRLGPALGITPRTH